MSAKSDSKSRQVFNALEQVQAGSLRLTTPDGTRMHFGAGAPEAQLHLKDWSTFAALMTRGDIGFGEAYIDGLWDSPDIETLVAFAMNNQAQLARCISGALLSQKFFTLADVMLRANSRAGSRRNIKAHYDVGNDFYRLWLDDGMTYSSAVYGEAGEPLEQAQNRKYDRLLNLSQGNGARTLEIGCGWGGFAERAADSGRHVTAITISKAQLSYARDRLDRRADVRLEDYRDLRGTYDSIVSIEMIEAVGERYWPTYFRTLKRNLAEGGRAAIQAIIVKDEDFPTYRRRSDFIRRHVFPGGMLLAPERIRAHAARVGLAVDDEFRFGADYMRTLREWLSRFEAAGASIRALGYTEKFVRGWRFYLAACAGLFRAGQTDVIQVGLKHA